MFVLRQLSILSTVALLAFTLSCGGDPATPTAKVYRMGDRAVTGPITYVGLTAEYRAELPEAKGPLKHQYLVVFLSATNGGGQEATLPHTRLIGADGAEYPEVTEIENMGQWMGVLRRVAPSSTEQGYVVFDVPVGAYKLQVSSGGDPEKEQLAQIELPTKIVPATPPSVAGPALGN
jgi:hypothetical protein